MHIRVATTEDPTAFLLRSAVVEPTRRGLGVGSRLIRAALEQVEAVNAPVALLTDTAVEYFPRCGFTPAPS